MDLARLYQNCNTNSGFSRGAGEVYSAINRAGFNVYAATAKEQSGFFIKFDETSLTLLPTSATQEYSLPADCSQIVHLAERPTASENWHPMTPESLGDALSSLQDACGLSDFFSSVYGSESEFGYYGPYLDSADAQSPGDVVQTQKIRVTPIPDITRFVQIVYTAKWMPILNAGSTLMLPDEATAAVESYASAELCGKSDDVTRMKFYAEQAGNDLTNYLTWVRARQVQSLPTIKPYGPGY